VAAVGKLVQKKRRQLYTKGEAIHKTIRKHRINRKTYEKRTQTLKNIKKQNSKN
jgi:hypothetical protein